MTMLENTFSATDVLEMLGGKISYRQLDCWCRQGTIQIAHDTTGSGVHRRFTPIEVAAIAELAGRYRATLDELETIRNGIAFDRLLRKFEVDAAMAAPISA